MLCYETPHLKLFTVYKGQVFSSSFCEDFCNQQLWLLLFNAIKISMGFLVRSNLYRKWGRGETFNELIISSIFQDSEKN